MCGYFTENPSLVPDGFRYPVLGPFCDFLFVVQQLDESFIHRDFGVCAVLDVVQVQTNI